MKPEEKLKSASVSSKLGISKKNSCMVSKICKASATEKNMVGHSFQNYDKVYAGFSATYTRLHMIRMGFKPIYTSMHIIVCGG